MKHDTCAFNMLNEDMLDVGINFSPFIDVARALIRAATYGTSLSTPCFHISFPVLLSPAGKWVRGDHPQRKLPTALSLSDGNYSAPSSSPHMPAGESQTSSQGSASGRIELSWALGRLKALPDFRVSCPGVFART